jgi:hypothetical protein
MNLFASGFSSASAIYSIVEQDVLLAIILLFLALINLALGLIKN